MKSTNSKCHNLVTKNNNKFKSQQNNAQMSFSKYQLQDYSFLEEYQMIQSQLNSQTEFLAKIKNTDQYVKFKKTQFKKDKQTHQRFQSLVILFNKGVILADNIFLLQENGKYFYYVIEAYLNQFSERFITLDKYLKKNHKSITFQNKKSIFQKLKVLYDSVYQQNQPFCGFNTKKIIIDNQEDPNLYLMPFQLEITIINNLYIRSYYSPQIIQLLQKQEEQQQLSPKQAFQKKDLNSWDIWSLGCVTLQIFFCLTPFFMCTSLKKQLQKMKKSSQQIILSIERFFKFQQEKNNLSLVNQFENSSIHDSNDCSISLILNQKDQKQTNLKKIKTFLKNSLSYEVQNRYISFQQPQIQQLSTINKRFNQTNQINQRTNSKQKNQNKKLASKQKNPYFLLQSKQREINNWKELNVFLNKSDPKDNGDYEFTIKFLTLSNINFKKQLKISLFLAKDMVYSFHIDFQSQFKTYTLNRKLTLTKKQFKFLREILQKPIYLQLNEQSKKSKIELNLQTLVMTDQGKRIWKNALIGSYQAKSGEFQKCKIKLNCKITQLSDQIQNLQTFIQNQKIKPSQEEVDQIFQCLKERKAELQNRNNEINPNVLQKQDSKPNVISKINNQLSQLSNYWKSKNSIDKKENLKI